MWPFAQGHADLNPHPSVHLTTKLQRLPITSAAVIAPGGLSIARGDKTVTLVPGTVVDALHVCQVLTALFHSQQPWQVYYPHLTGEETEAQKAEALTTCGRAGIQT